jgi:hypothetical protein
MTVNLTTQESEEIFYSSLCNAVGTGYMSGYGIQLRCDRNQYKDCKEHLERINPGVEQAWEDILMQILRDGGNLTFEDVECEGEYTRSISMKDVHERVRLAPIEAILNFVKEQDDAGDADLVLQTVFYKEVLFG